MKIIIPCAGKSTHFPQMRPKWMLNHPNGDLLVKQAISGFDVKPFDIVITILKKHEEKYEVIRGMKDNIGAEITVVTLDKQTQSQAETVYLTLKELSLNDSFFVKDSDNTFSLSTVEQDYNYVCYSDLQDYEEINPGNKSYIEINHQRIITNIVEKQVISRFFNVGGYFFTNPKDFEGAFERLSARAQENELYISHLIEELIVKQDIIFFGEKVDRYIDWGTFEQWSRFRKQFRTYFIDLDGVVFKSAAQFFAPRWEDAEFNVTNADAVKKLSENPCVQIYFVTARPESYREQTEAKLKSYGIDYSDVIMGCLHAQRTMINDFSNTTGYPTCDSVNILRDSEDLKKYL